MTAAVMAAVTLAACAKEAYPQGGPKDTTPPKVLGTNPANGTLNWSARDFIIYFDEYVTVKDADNNILVSPPMKQKPEYSTKGHGLQVKIKDTLRENTTYLFQFKGGIVDFNEGNPLASYEYVFSTGSSIDSMTIRGRVLDAFTRKPYKEVVTVMAYRDTCHNDSIVAKEQPVYMTRCDTSGRFALNHMSEGRYRIIAIEDADKNMMLSTGEAVAFLDSLVPTFHMPIPPVVDTTKADSTAVDSTAAAETKPQPDSTASSVVEIPTIDMNISLLKQERQRVTKSEFRKKGMLEIITQLPLSEHYSLRHSDSNNTSLLYVHASPHRDTLTVYTQQIGCDSVVLVLNDTNLCDTLKMKYQEKKIVGKKPTMPTKLAMMKSLVKNSHHYFDTLWIALDPPAMALTDSLADSLVTVMHLKDSTTSHAGLRLADPCTPAGYSRAMIVFDGKAGEKYKFAIPQGLIRDIYGRVNQDSLAITTEYTKAESYGNIILTITLDTASAPVLLQLTNDKGETLRQQRVTTDGKYTFAHLKGGSYIIRAVIDLNNDGQWTAGDYWKQRQPEEVLFFEKTLELRENWDMEEKWEIGNN